MKAIVTSSHGGPGVLEVAEVPDPVPGPGQLLIDVAYAGLNFIDTYKRSGVYDSPARHIPGSEGSGRVIGRGEGVEGWWDDTRVAFNSARGAYASKVVIDAEDAMFVPDYIPLSTAAALPLQGMTAHYLIRSVFPVTEGTKLLITGGAGGVGRLACQLAAFQGATVVTTTGSKDKLAFLTHATYPLLIEDWSQVPGMITERVGHLDVVYDGIGKASFEHTLACLRPRGLMCLFGGASGQVPPFDLQELNRHGSLFVTRPTLNDYLGEERQWRWGELTEYVRTGKLDVLIGHISQLEDADSAHELIESGSSVGKILLKVADLD